MKKIVYLAAAMLVCLSAAANGTGMQVVSDNNLTETWSAAAWKDDGVVSGLTFVFGSSRMKGRISGQHPIQYDSDTGQYRINFKGEWYKVKVSDRQEFDYMFHADKTYYFNH